MAPRNDISRKNKWWIPKNRFLELKYYCLQVPDWQKTILQNNESIGIHAGIREGLGIVSPDSKFPDWKYVSENVELKNRIELINESAKISGGNFSKYIFEQVTEGRNYSYLLSHYSIPISSTNWHDAYYRKFFWVLDKKLRNIQTI